MVKVVAQSGEDRFLVQVDEGIGRVVELDTGIVFPPFNIDSIIARGYWDEVTDKDKAEMAVVKAMYEILHNEQHEDLEVR